METKSKEEKLKEFRAHVKDFPNAKSQLWKLIKLSPQSSELEIISSKMVTEEDVKDMLFFHILKTITLIQKRDGLTDDDKKFIVRAVLSDLFSPVILVMLAIE